MYKICSLFAGVGGIDLGFLETNKCEIAYANEFDKYAVDFYNEVDVERGYVEVANRRGIIEQFPLTSISIAVLEVDSKIYKTTLEIGEVAGQIKHQAKTIFFLHS